MGPAGGDTAKEAQAAQLKQAQSDLAAGKTLTPDQTALIKSTAQSAQDSKDSLIKTGVGAVSGAAGGALQALLTKPQQKYMNAVPGGHSGSVPGMAIEGAQMQKPVFQNDQGPSLALEMLRKGGYK